MTDFTLQALALEGLYLIRQKSSAMIVGVLPDCSVSPASRFRDDRSLSARSTIHVRSKKVAYEACTTKRPDMQSPS